MDIRERSRISHLVCDFSDYFSGVPPVNVTVGGLTGTISNGGAFVYHPLIEIKPDDFHSILCKQAAAYIREEWPERAPNLMLRQFYSFIEPSDFKLTKVKMYLVPAKTAYVLELYVSYETPDKNALISSVIKLHPPLDSVPFKKTLTDLPYEDL